MPVAFDSEEGFDRMANAVRRVEGDTHTPRPGRDDYHPEANRVTIRVTSGTPDADGFYPAVLVSRAVAQQENRDTASPAITGFTDSDWKDFPPVFVAQGLNGGALENDKRYDGWIIGMKSGYPVAIVNEIPTPSGLRILQTTNFSSQTLAIGSQFNYTDILTTNETGIHIILGQLPIAFNGATPTYNYFGLDFNGGTRGTYTSWAAFVSLGSGYEFHLPIHFLISVVAAPCDITLRLTNFFVSAGAIDTNKFPNGSFWQGSVSLVK